MFFSCLGPSCHSKQHWLINPWRWKSPAITSKLLFLLPKNSRNGELRSWVDRAYSHDIKLVPALHFYEKCSSRDHCLTKKGRKRKVKHLRLQSHFLMMQDNLLHVAKYMAWNTVQCNFSVQNRPKSIVRKLHNISGPFEKSVLILQGQYHILHYIAITCISAWFQIVFIVFGLSYQFSVNIFHCPVFIFSSLILGQLYACPSDPRGNLLDMVTPVDTEPQTRYMKPWAMWTIMKCFA